MSEDKHDNLQQADGSENQENLIPQTRQAEEAETFDQAASVTETEMADDDADPAIEIDEDPTADVVAPIDAMLATEARENDDVPGDLLTEGLIDQNPDADLVQSPSIEAAEAADALAREKNIDQSAEIIHSIEREPSAIVPEGTEEAVSAIEQTNAEESEDESLKQRHDMPMRNYDELSMDELVSELEKITQTDSVMAVKDHVEEIKRSFLTKYHHLVEEKRAEHVAQHEGDGEDFHYHLPVKTRFDQLYHQYRDRKNAHFKNLQNNLQSNLETRLAIVEELKNLINPQENIKDTLKHFNDLRERWKNAGPIPKDKYNHVWNNYHFHVENFYDYLHLDREARDLDFKHNLEQKQKIVERVRELVEMPDVNKAFRELQDLHRMWKEEIGPVSREHREEIWNQFSELTRQMHDKREALFAKQREGENENLAKKQEIIAKIEALATEKMNSHAGWLGQIEKVEALRKEFFATGKVPVDVNESTWAAFKNAVRNFNSLKNSFYKDIKKDQSDNLARKNALIARARELQDSKDYAATTPVMKQIQEEWKQIGHVPRKYSDKLWKDFKAACNHYFEQMKENRQEESGEELEAFEKKKAYLETVREFQLSGDHRSDLDAIKAHIEHWKSLGKVPQGRRHIEGKFNKILDHLFEKLSLSKKESEMVRFSNRVGHLAETNDTRKIDNEKIFLMRKIDEVQAEIFQLENNIQFFAHAKKDNPMVAEVRKNIEKHKEELAVLKEKLKQVRSLGQ